MFAEWKNSTFDWMTSRLKYQYMHRTGEFNPHPEVLAANPMDLFVRRFDVANVDQNLVKAAFDFTPAPLFDLGVEVIYKENNTRTRRSGAPRIRAMRSMAASATATEALARAPSATSST